ncbi:MAG: cytochrome c [Desulfocapsaceae bacterium]|jgi:mono/diheme cytochrome c family protein|nr:cytochrome c [Desulfocapsaceae bacterium]
MATLRKLFLPLIVLAGTAIVLGACTTPKGNVDNGKRWYMMNNCYSCHGLHGNDGKAPHIDADDLSFRRFLAIIRDAKSPIMPKFPEEKVSRQDAADMYAWLNDIQ